LIEHSACITFEEPFFGFCLRLVAFFIHTYFLIEETENIGNTLRLFSNKHS
jgi:hypothetical protein